MKKMNLGRMFLFLLLVLALVASTACSGAPAAPAAPASPAAPVSGTPAAPAAPAPAAKKVTVRIGCGQTPEGYLWVKAMKDYFMPTIDKELAKTGNYKIDWVESWGGTVAKTTECLESVQSGLLDVSWVGYVFEQSNLRYGNLTYYVPFGVWDVDTALKVQLDFLKKYPVLYQEFEKFGQKAIGISTSETYNMSSKFKYTKLNDMKGMRVGAAGSNLSWVTPLATKIQSSGVEAYNALQTGMYEIALQPTSFHRDLFFYEVAPYGLIGDFGCVWMGAVTVNSKFLAGLPEEVQKAFTVGGDAYTKGDAELCQKAYDDSIKVLNEKCKEVVTLTTDQKKEWAATLENVPLNYVLTMEKDNLPGAREMMKDYLATLKKEGVDVIRDWEAELPAK